MKFVVGHAENVKILSIYQMIQLVLIVDKECGQQKIEEDAII